MTSVRAYIAVGWKSVWRPYGVRVNVGELTIMCLFVRLEMRLHRERPAAPWIRAHKRFRPRWHVRHCMVSQLVSLCKLGITLLALPSASQLVFGGRCSRQMVLAVRAALHAASNASPSRTSSHIPRARTCAADLRRSSGFACAREGARPGGTIGHSWDRCAGASCQLLDLPGDTRPSYLSCMCELVFCQTGRLEVRLVASRMETRKAALCTAGIGRR